MNTQRPSRARRLLEFVPGVVSLTLITFPAWGSLFIPQIVAYFIIAFDVYWLYKSITLSVITTLSHLRMRASMAHDWLADLKKLPDAQKIHHIIIIPTYKEPLETLRTTLTYLKNQDYPGKRLHVVLGGEVREETFTDKALTLQEEFQGSFGHLWATHHPDIAGEVKGKSSNEAFAAKYAKAELVDKEGVPIENITISSVDADARFHEKYFSALTYEFLTRENRNLLFFEPVLLYYNNIWRVPAPIRVVNTLSNIWQTARLSKPDSLINHACYSASLVMIDGVGYWDVDVIPEDYRIFFKCFFHYNGDVKVAPIYLPVSLDAAEGKTYWESLVNQYQQLKRWAWGTSDDPYVFMQFWKTKSTNSFAKILRLFKLMEEHFLWPVNWFIITLGATIPPLVNPKFKATVLGQNLSVFPSIILSLTLVTLVLIIVIDARQRPPRPAHISMGRRLLMNLEFLLMPVAGFFFSALPGLDAHTRLMLGKYIEYKVTEKLPS